MLVRPPSSTAAHVPSFELEQQIELCTDAFDSTEREILALGGVPTPATAFLAQPPSLSDLERQVSSPSSARSSFTALR